MDAIFAELIRDTPEINDFLDYPAAKMAVLIAPILAASRPTIPAEAWAALLGAFEQHKQQEQGRSDAAIWDEVMGEISR